MSPDLVVVAIGRDEGERLRRCLDSLAGLRCPIVYVDSGSRDGSPGLARAMAAEVVELDPGLPFTAGRGRNEGLVRALQLHPGLELVQFVDGDCELASGWLEHGRDEFRSDDPLAAVCGRVREANREASIYNRLCDMEWDAPPGEARSCGGNAMMRVQAFREVGGFRPGFIAGEEPELCLRLRAAGWRIRRTSDDMVRHDAAMTRFSQWWRRARRAGWAYAAGAVAHGASGERHNVREVGRISSGADCFRSRHWGSPILGRGFPAAARWLPAALGARPCLGAGPGLRSPRRRAARHLHGAGQAAPAPGSGRIPPGADRTQGTGSNGLEGMRSGAQREKAPTCVVPGLPPEVSDPRRRGEPGAGRKSEVAGSLDGRTNQDGHLVATRFPTEVTPGPMFTAAWVPHTALFAATYPVPSLTLVEKGSCTLIPPRMMSFPGGAKAVLFRTVPRLLGVDPGPRVCASSG